MNAVSNAEADEKVWFQLYFTDAAPIRTQRSNIRVVN